MNARRQEGDDERSAGIAERKGRVDAEIHRIAARQHGVLSRKQLMLAGVPRHAIANRVRNGRLEVIWRGVYRAGPVRAPLGVQMAAVLACGESALLSHRSQAGVLGIMARGSADAPVHVTTVRRHPNPGAGIRVHRVGAMRMDEVTVAEGIPGTAPGRTILDLAAEMSPRGIERLIGRAERQRLTSCDELRGLLERHPRRAGTRLLRRILSLDGGPAFVRSEAEGLLLDMVRSAGLPTPRTNTRVAGFEVDFFWPSHRLIAEVDGYTFHAYRQSVEDDHQRDRRLKLAGFDVLRFTVRDLTEGRDKALKDLVEALVLSRLTGLDWRQSVEGGPMGRSSPGRRLPPA